jgi:hypothetical protein
MELYNTSQYLRHLIHLFRDKSLASIQGIVLLINLQGGSLLRGAIKMEVKNLKLLWVRLPDAGELS